MPRPPLAGWRHLAFAQSVGARWCARRQVGGRLDLAFRRAPAPAAGATTIHAPLYAVTTRIEPRWSLNIRWASLLQSQTAPFGSPAPAGAGPIDRPRMAHQPIGARPLRVVHRELRLIAPVRAATASPGGAPPVSEPVLPKPGLSGGWGPLAAVLRRIERDPIRRIESVVRQVRRAQRPDTGHPGPSTAVEAARPLPPPWQRPAAGPAAQQATAAAFSETEVRRLTDRVVGDINRRILGQRERLGRH